MWVRPHPSPCCPSVLSVLKPKFGQFFCASCLDLRGSATRTSNKNQTSAPRFLTVGMVYPVSNIRFFCGKYDVSWNHQTRKSKKAQEKNTTWTLLITQSGMGQYTKITQKLRHVSWPQIIAKNSKRVDKNTKFSKLKTASFDIGKFLTSTVLSDLPSIATCSLPPPESPQLYDINSLKDG